MARNTAQTGLLSAQLLVLIVSLAFYPYYLSLLMLLINDVYRSNLPKSAIKHNFQPSEMNG